VSRDVEVRHDLGRSVTLTAGDVELLTYVYRPDTPVLESPKPYIHPIRTLGGDEVSLFRPHDHVWHKGIAWALPNVGEHNFWGGPSYVHGEGYVQLDNNGTATHQEMTRLAAVGDRAEVAHRLAWRSQAGDLVIEEQRSLAAALIDDRTWALTFSTAMTNVSGETLNIGSPTTKGRDNAGYGGLLWRGPRSFTGGLAQGPEGSGSGNDLRGARSAWMGFRGQHDGTGRWSTVVMVDHADNPRHPPLWFVRSEEFACLCPAPFFNEEVSVGDEETIEFRYAVVIADGDHYDEGAARLATHGRSLLASRQSLSAAATTRQGTSLS
jgi:hypothetical protein